LPHHLIARVRHRGEIPSVLLVLVPLDLGEGGAVPVPTVHEASHAVRVRGHAGLELPAQRFVNVPLPLGEADPLLHELLLGRLQLRRLLVRQAQVLADPLTPAFADLLAQLLRLDLVARVRVMLGRPCRSPRVTSPAPSSSRTAAAILSHAGCIPRRAVTVSGGASRSRVTTACAVRSTSSRSAAPTPSRCASSCNLASGNS